MVTSPEDKAELLLFFSEYLNMLDQEGGGERHHRALVLLLFIHCRSSASLIAKL